MDQKIEHHWRMLIIIGIIVICFGGHFRPVFLDRAWAQVDETLQDTFLISQFSSTFSGGFIIFTTAVSVTNVNYLPCRVRVHWHSKGKSDMDQCTTESTIAPNDIQYYCSNELPTYIGFPTECHICNPSLFADEGYAIVQTSGACFSRLGVDAMIYAAEYQINESDNIIGTVSFGIHNPKIYRFDAANVTE